MIRVDDPTQVTLRVIVKDAVILRDLIARATDASSGIVYTDDESKLYRQFCEQIERAESIQRSIYAQLYAGPGAAPVMLPVLSRPARFTWWQRLWFRIFGGGA